jgi:hypothetical protein
MSAPVSDDRNPTELTPHSGVQFMTCHLNLPDAARFRRMFVERTMETGRERNMRSVWLYPNWSADDPSRQGDALDDRPGDESYVIKAEQALEPYIGKWVPVPYLRMQRGSGGQQFDRGPTNWARVRVVECDGAEPAGCTHRVIFAFDTELTPVSAEAGPYTAPTIEDVAGQWRFRLASDTSSLIWFIQGGRMAAMSPGRPEEPHWGEEWLKALFDRFRQASVRPGALPSDRYHEHSARWWSFVHLLAEFAKPPVISFIDTVSENANEFPRQVDVDFVLDVGNSRTCGILVERFPNQDAIDLNKCRPLRLRDLSEPHRVYTEAFESHAELASAEFGEESFSLRAGRPRAFFWPSAVRIGPEAARIRGEKTARSTTGGVSSPKRYLWNMEEVNLDWRFAAESYFEGIGPPVERRLQSFVNQNGDVLSKVRAEGDIFKSLYGRREDVSDKSAAKLRFSRSSFYTFMLAEVIWQAWAMINDPAVRAEGGETGLARRLGKIILTLPTATPVREQRIMRMRAESAVALLWDMMGWTREPPRGVTKPRVEVKWDEATCVQLVWLYGEIVGKFAGNVEAFFNLAGRPRRLAAGAATPQPCLRVASIDIGGGTTDLMIITYTQIPGQPALRPEQNFREGVRIAGDDILKLVIERLVLRSIQHHLQGSGMSATAAQTLLRDCFDAPRSSEDEHRRWQITTEVFVPAGLALLHAYEGAPRGRYDRSETRTLLALVRGDREKEGRTRNFDRAAEFIEKRAHAAGARDFKLADTPVPIDCDEMRRAVNDAMDDVFNIMSETLDHFDVDVLILSGRPARLPAVCELIADRFAVPPNRIVSLHRYRAGPWFPFRPENGRIADPKTAVVVGALLCNYAQRQLRGFYYDTDPIRMRSTARYIGVRTTNDGKMSNQSVWFTPGGAIDNTIEHMGSQIIVARQLPHDRWVTAPLYQLSIASNDVDIKQPITIDVRRESDGGDTVDTSVRQAQAEASEASKEQLKIVSARDATGKNVMQWMKLSFRTMSSEESDYWLDTGKLRI